MIIAVELIVARTLRGDCLQVDAQLVVRMQQVATIFSRLGFINFNLFLFISQTATLPYSMC